MRGDGNQRESDHVYGRRLSALQTESDNVSPSLKDAPHQSQNPMEDADGSADHRDRVIATTCEETARRLRLQTEQLKRFHQQICLRVNERVLQQREHQQCRDKRLDAKLARLLQLPCATAGKGANPPTATAAAAPRSLHLSRGPHVESLMKVKRDQLRGYATTLSQVDKAVRSDAQARDMLLASTRVARVRASRSCEDLALNEMYDDEGNQAHDGNGEHRERVEDDGALPSKQRVELYAAVRRQYMAMERERVRQRVKGPGDSKLPAQLSSSKGKKAVNTNRPTDGERQTDGHVRVVDASTGCETKLQRQAARTPSTPWRNSSSQQAAASSTKSLGQATIHERFLTALQAELGTPALCSCGDRNGSRQCANNCEFYRQPKRKERAATSVCKQHTSDNH